MEASGAAGTTDTSAAAEAPIGNGIVVVCGQFEPGSVVELIERGETDVRADQGAVRGRRSVDANGEVGFDGLTPGDLFFVVGYAFGRLEEVRCVAQDPSSGITMLQPPEQPLAQAQGTAQTPVVEEPPAEPQTAPEGDGLPAGVESPILEAAPDTAEATSEVGSAAADAGPAQTTEGDEGHSESPEQTTTGESAVDPQAAPSGTDSPPADAEPPSGTEATEATAQVIETAQTAPETKAAVAATATTDIGASASGTTASADAAPTSSTPPAPAEADNTAEGASAASEAEAAPAAAVEAAPSSDAPPAAEATTAPDVWTQLVAQAKQLGVPNADALGDDELRQAIAEKNVEPVA